ncbi:DUF47 domain-containing protein [Priestia megaterium]|uniref:DUF47 domain-containing protein n=1 Tax=Priestia megaterium TaxID=1404 RepID=UPI001F49AC0F|nr:DUF47 domain-containing protein [Priestia megaterium]MDI3094853.1 DUF47 domain-containing protein [Priestia megaterium]MED3862182.1 DUF47 domain-containing protein [Priestia megaterium]MED4100288.1 DUF47 domain-containing protein [Priestia megaterium]MED4142840.1 DUF47 domain-containing protein [Priestia megaterium]MED4167609.1 DUF47 domain-containing protein [Priestia megaterium]
MEDCNVIKRKKDKFSEMLMDIAQNIKDSAEFLGSFELQNVSDLKEFANVLKAYESKGDKYVHTVITELNKAFITPIEREDILQLAMSMDDVLDGIDSFAALMEIHSITTFDEYVAEFVKNIQGCAEEILITINLLSEKKLLQISEHAIKIKEYESHCDTLYRRALKQLFATCKDPIKVIQYKEIYETLEEIADYCQTVANNLESVIMKNV